MIALFRVLYPMYVSHLVTFGVLIVGRMLFGDDPRAVLILGALMPVWALSTTLWSCREAPYRFLRVLPTTAGDIVGAQFILSVLQVGVMWLLGAAVILVRAGSPGAMAAAGLFLALSGAGSLVLAAIGYLVVYRFGRGVAVAIIVPTVFLLVFTAVAVLIDSWDFRPADLAELDQVRALLEMPLGLPVAGLIVLGVAYLALFRQAVSTWRRNEALV